MTDKFYDHLYGRKYSVLTDNNPLKYVMSSAKLDATGQRWVSRLAGFEFDAQYRKGRSNANADALSRMSTQEVTEALQTCPQQVRASQPQHGEGQFAPSSVSPISQSTAASGEPQSEPPRSDEPYRDVGMESLPLMTKQELRAGQKEDPVIGPVLHYRSLKRKPSRSERDLVGRCAFS